MAANFSSGSTFSTEKLIWLLGSLCQMQRIPWNSALVLQLYPPPHTVRTLYEAGKQYGFRFGECGSRGFDWSRATYPLVAFRSDGDSIQPMLVAKADEGRLLYFEPGSGTPRVVRRTPARSSHRSIPTIPRRRRR